MSLYSFKFEKFVVKYGLIARRDIEMNFCKDSKRIGKDMKLCKLMIRS